METGKKINAIIVDDEKGCITNLEHFLDKLCPDISVIGTGRNLGEALANATTKIDLAFLDVEIFDDNIFNSLDKLGKFDFKIVFVTAYQQYALRAIKIEAIDYILKPLSDDDILECYSKIRKHFYSPGAVTHVIRPDRDDEKKKLIIKSADYIYIITADDIYYIAGSGFYSEITFLFNDKVKSIKLSKPLNKIEEEYAFPFLYRVHKSYIININKVANLLKHDGLNIKMTNDYVIPVAKRRVNEFLYFLNH